MSPIVLDLQSMTVLAHVLFFFFFNDTATTEIYTLSLHDALPISSGSQTRNVVPSPGADAKSTRPPWRSEEHTSELQSHSDLVCRLLLEKKKKKNKKKINRSNKRNTDSKTISMAQSDEAHNDTPRT